MEIIKLRFKTPYKITSDTGQLGDIEEYIHSDTLTGAIWSLWSWLYPESFEKILPNEDETEPKFKISSAFFCKDNIYFYPIPLSTDIKIDKTGNDVPSSTMRKRKKKISYLEEEVFKDALKGKTINLEDLKVIQNKFAVYKDSEEKSSSLKDDKIFVAFEKERNVLDRVTDASKNIYYSNEIKLAENAALFFLTEFFSEEFKKQFLAVLRLLGDEGIGADRKIGKGLFEVEEMGTPEINEIDSNHFVNLSMFNPNNSEHQGIDYDNSYFDILSRGGWVTQPVKSTQLKKNVKMFNEGSVIDSEKSLMGRSVNISPNGDAIWRAGYFLGFPIKVNKEQ